jgi:hypothetical protein
MVVPTAPMERFHCWMLANVQAALPQSHNG